jgi:endonuclease I
MNALRLRRHVSVALFVLLAAGVVLADAPPGYYDSVDTSSAAALRLTVHNVIDDHVRYPYTSGSTDTWNVLEYSDEDPFDSGRILDIYQNRTFIKYGAGNTEYDREHVWPKSYGFPDEGGSYPYTDCHHLHLCDTSYNSARGNLIFDDCAGGCTSYTADYYDDQGGVNLRDGDSWEVWDGRKGDIARSMLYMDVRYEGGVGEPDLILTDNQSLIQTTSTNASVAYMGLLSTLLQWHADDPVSPREMTRNDRVQSYQGNRNPFVDHPEWVGAIFQGVLLAADDVPAPARIVGAYPNPFNPSVRLSFALERGGDVRIEVFSLDGRRVRTLFAGTRESGGFDLVWDGTDEQGGALGSGTYLCRMKSGDAHDARRLTLVK